MSEIKTYDEMNKQICGLLRLAGDNVSLYAAQRITELEAENADLTVNNEVLQRDVDNLTRTLEEGNEEHQALQAENAELKEKWNNQRCIYSYDGEVMEYCVNGPCSDMKTIADVRKETARDILYEISLHCGGDWLISLFKKYGISGDTQ